MSAYIAIALIILNCALMLSFYLGLRSRFSAGRILREIREEIDRLVVDLGRETDRDVALLESRIKGLRALIDEADRRVLVAGREEDKRVRSGKIIDQLEPRPSVDAQTPVGAQTRDEKEAPAAHKPPAMESPVRREPVTVYTRPAVARSGRQIQPVVPLRERVLEMARKDISPEMIASTLSMSLGEVELILDMNDSSL